ncbi:MAG: prolyl oligopeptidase family serine peptidase [Bacteroidales bacterium]
MKKLVILLFVIPVIFISCGREETKEVKKYSIEQFMDNISVYGSSFSPDEKKILFTSNESGVYNAFEIVLDKESKSQLTKREETTRAISYFPEDERILLASDEGGNEIYHIYLRDEDGEIKDITPYEGARASFAGWSRDEKSFFFSCNKRDSRYMDLYEMPLKNMEPELIYKNTKGYNIGPVSNDKNLIALTKTITNTKNEMYLHNRESGETEKISDFEGDASFNPVDFSNNQKFLYYITDADSDFKYLSRMNLETGETEKIFEADWDVMYAYHSYNEKYRVIGINEDAQTVVKVFNTETGKEVDFPDFKDKNITSVDISKSEDKMAFYASSSKTPSNLYVYDFNDKNHTQLTETLNPEINPDDLVAGEVVRYESFDGVEIPSILYKPHQASKKNPVPSLVWVHGGPGGQSRLGYSATIQYLVNHGYSVIAVNNRGSSGYGKEFYKMDDRKHGDADLKDCIYAKNYLAEQAWADTSQVGIIGGSYGGYMVVAALAFEPYEFEVGVDIFGVTNWLRTLKSIPSWWEAQREALYKELGHPEKDSAYLHKISPLFHAEKIRKPLMVLQGANDPRVLKVESDEIVEKVKSNDVPVEYVVFEDEGHGFSKKENEIEAYGKILDFLDEYLKGEKPTEE